VQQNPSQEVDSEEAQFADVTARARLAMAVLRILHTQRNSKKMILTYHEIVPEPSAYVYSTTSLSMREHMSALSGLGNPPMITFDDGHRSHMQLAAPVLEDFGFRGVFFITGGWTSTRPGYMSWEELAQLVRSGHEIQSHGWSHQYLTDCSEDGLAVELLRSRQTLEDRLGIHVTGISMPGGRYDSRVLNACAAAGYKHVYTSDPFQRSVVRNNVTVCGRVMLRRTMNAAAVLRILDSEHQVLSRFRLEHAAKKAVQKALGDRVYQHLWNLAGRSSARAAINQSFSE
jgi:peptidoglycan/xylan/chitin deacetylase (PgdA/CDA1 family)